MRITLNLLPPKYKAILKKKRFFRRIINQQFIIALWMLVTLSSLGAISILLSGQVSIVKSANDSVINQSEYAEVTELHKIFDETNRRTQVVQEIQDEGIFWSTMLDALGQVVSPDVRITQIKTSDNLVTMKGVAQSAKVLVALKDRMEAFTYDGENCFDNVVVPDEFLVKQNEAEFAMGYSKSEVIC